MTRPSMVVIGTGAFARSLCYAAAALFREPATVTVIGRTPERVEEVCAAAGARALAAGSGVTYRPLASDLRDAEDLADRLAAAEAQIVVVCASRQSPWERRDAPSAWTSLLDAGGVALWLPLNAALALLAGTALGRLPRPPRLVNACYPDAVNPLLAAVGIPVLCGVGNVALLDLALREEFGTDADLRVIGHHYHLYPRDARREARVWLDGRERHDVGRLLARHRAVSRTELNALAGFDAAVTVRALLFGEERRTSLPGPHGLPGGYPVTVRDGRLETDLPPGLDLARAIAWNQAWAHEEGVVVDPDLGAVKFAPPIRELLAPHLGARAEGFAARECAAVADELMRVRERLRRLPPR